MVVFPSVSTSYHDTYDSIHSLIRGKLWAIAGLPPNVEYAIGPKSIRRYVLLVGRNGRFSMRCTTV